MQDFKKITWNYKILYRYHFDVNILLVHTFGKDQNC